MKKKLPIAPVRAKVRGTCEVHASSTVAVRPGASGSGNGTAMTVSSFAFRSEEKAADSAGPRESARHVRGPRELDRGGAAGRERLGQRHGHDRLVVRVVVVRRDEALDRRQIRDGRRGQLDRGNDDV